jgi:hypothetical protein
MTTPSGNEPDAQHGEPQAPRDEPEAPFDPYRFGKPEHPVPPEYAPPGYVPDPYPPQPTQPTQPGQPYQPAQPYQDPYGQQPHGGYGPGAQGGPGYYGQQPMAPQPPYQNMYGQPRTGNGKAIASMVLGIASIVFFWLTVIDLVLIITSVVLGIMALAERRGHNREGRGMAIAGLVCSAIGTAAAVITTVWFVHVAGQCGGLENTNDPAFRQCLQNHI